MYKCQACLSGYSLWNGICISNGQQTGCSGGQGLISGTCTNCTVPGCEYCPATLTICNKCLYNSNNRLDISDNGCKACNNADCDICYYNIL